jgi:hypothetical protein
MEVLAKTVRKLSEEKFNNLVNFVSGNKKNNSYVLLETARKNDFSDQDMIKKLELNPSTYYTLKSRLSHKVAEFISRNEQDPINELVEEVKRAPSLLYGSNRKAAIITLKNLEKKLIEYDLNNELIIVYKLLARLNRLYLPEKEHYEQQYTRRVAFTLAVSKAEDLLLEFTRCIGVYSLSRGEKELEEVKKVRRELLNICELYDSHRLFVISNIVHLYYLSMVDSKREEIRTGELEIEKTLGQIGDLYNKYSLDLFYKQYKNILDLHFFELYRSTGSHHRADVYYKRINSSIPEIASRHYFSFFITRYLEGKMEKNVMENDLRYLTDLNRELEADFDVSPEDVYPYIIFKKFLAAGKFFEGDYTGASRALNTLRNEISLKQFLHTDIECKLFHGILYCLNGEYELVQQITGSVKRQLKKGDGYDNADTMLKILTVAVNRGMDKMKAEKIKKLLSEFESQNKSSKPLLTFIRFTDPVIRKMVRN